MKVRTLLPFVLLVLFAMPSAVSFGGYGHASLGSGVSATNATNTSVAPPPRFGSGARYAGTSAPETAPAASTPPSSAPQETPARQPAPAPTNDGGSSTVITQPAPSEPTQPAVHNIGGSAIDDGGDTGALAASTGAAPTAETPAATTSPGALYSLIAIIAGVALLIGALVVGLVKRHHQGTTLPTPPPGPVITPQAKRATDESETLIVHHPSVEEARQYVTRCRTLGYTDPQIRAQFVSYGWTDEQAAIAMRRE